MREHKFKLWDKKNKCWIDIYDIALKEKEYKDLMYCDMEGFGIMEDGSLIIADECGQYKYLDSERFEVVEYTGLKDKNGYTEIFEYDIIDENGIVKGNYYENKYLLKKSTNFFIKRMGTQEWKNTEQEAIKRGCKYAE